MHPKHFLCLPTRPPVLKVGPFTRLSREPWRPAYVYYARVSGTSPLMYKVGVAFDFQDRLRSRLEALAIWHHANKDAALTHERQILSDHKAYLLKDTGRVSLPKGGASELFVTDVLRLDDRTNTGQHDRIPDAMLFRSTS